MTIFLRPLRTLLFLAPLVLLKAQAPAPTNNNDQFLASSDPKLAANKRLVYDFQRSILEAGHLELANQFLSETYIQHNPNVPTGRAGFVAFFSKFTQAKAIEPKVKSRILSMTAEGDLVILTLMGQVKDDQGKSFTIAWFDMFRIENGKIAEHWDPSPGGAYE